MDPWNIIIMCSVLGPWRDKEVLEWGSGGSTLFFSKFAKSWRSIDSNASWVSKFASQIHRYRAADPLLQVNVEYVPIASSSATTWYHSYDMYARKPANRKYDLIFIDGHARIDCARAVLRLGMLRDSNSRVIVHDVEDQWLWSAVRPLYKLEILDGISSKHMAVLYRNASVSASNFASAAELRLDKKFLSALALTDDIRKRGLTRIQN